VGPALTQLGIAPLAAHLFLLYFGMLSLITPPDCLATYAAAAIARADFWKTGWMGMRFGVVAYLVPFAFVFHPALLFEGTAVEIALAAGTAAAGVVLIAVGCVGYLFRPLARGRRAAALLAGGLLVAPPEPPAGLAANVGGLALGAILVLVERHGARLPRPAPARPGRGGP
jgi:TRAP-type uncharacterized transport system fused permease subunit